MTSTIFNMAASLECQLTLKKVIKQLHFYMKYGS
jgi:hypothetical protein